VTWAWRKPPGRLRSKPLYDALKPFKDRVAEDIRDG